MAIVRSAAGMGVSSRGLASRIPKGHRGAPPRASLSAARLADDQNWRILETIHRSRRGVFVIVNKPDRVEDSDLG